MVGIEASLPHRQKPQIRYQPSAAIGVWLHRRGVTDWRFAVALLPGSKWPDLIGDGETPWVEPR